MDDIYVEILEPEVTDIYISADLTVIEIYITVENGGGSGLFSSDIVFGETPAGTLNGVNATFTSLHPFIPEKLMVELNGLQQKLGDDYITTGNNTITFFVSPVLTDKILLNYIKL